MKIGVTGVYPLNRPWVEELMRAVISSALNKPEEVTLEFSEIAEGTITIDVPLMNGKLRVSELALLEELGRATLILERERAITCKMGEGISWSRPW